MDEMLSKLQVRSGSAEESNVGERFIGKAKQFAETEVLLWLSSRSV